MRPIRFLLDREQPRAPVKLTEGVRTLPRAKAPSPRHQSSGAEESPTALFTGLTIFEQSSRRSDEMVSDSGGMGSPTRVPDLATSVRTLQPSASDHPFALLPSPMHSFCSASIRMSSFPTTLSKIDCTISTLTRPESATHSAALECPPPDRAVDNNGRGWEQTITSAPHTLQNWLNKMV